MKLLLAGIPLEIRGLRAENKQFFRDYAATGINPLITLEAGRLQTHIEARNLHPRHAGDEALLENLAILRAFCHRALARDVLLLHASALKLHGQAILLTGPSGIGKSTQAEIWMDMTNAIPINDDKPFLHITKTKTTAYGSPWNGKHGLGYNIHGTVRAIFALRQGTEPAIRRLDPEEALPVLLSQCPRPRDEDLLLKTIGLAATLAKQVPVFELRCARNDQAVRLAYRTLLEEGLIKDKGTGHRS